MPFITIFEYTCYRNKERSPTGKAHPAKRREQTKTRGQWNQTYPLSRTNREIQHLSRPRKSSIPLSEAGSTSG